MSLSLRLDNVDIKDIDTTGAENTAEILQRAIDTDTVPRDSLTRERYGFSKCKDMDGEIHLGGPYAGLLFPVYLGVTRKAAP